MINYLSRLPRKLEVSVLALFALGVVAASFFVKTNSPSKYRLSNKKDIADDPTLVVTPKLLFKNSYFLVYESL